MFGISSWRRRAVLETDENRLLSLLDRRSSIDPLKALVSAMGSTSAKRDTRLSEIAIGLDSSVFLRLGQRAGADIVDYLDAEHPAPIILPGQAIQEFWNNQLSVVDTISTSLKKKYDALRSELMLPAQWETAPEPALQMEAARDTVAAFMRALGAAV